MIGWNIWRIFLKQFRNRSTRIWWKGLGICMLSPCLLYSQQTETRLPIRFHEGFGPFSPAYYSVRWDDTSFISRSGFDQLSGLNPGYKSIRQAIIWFEFAQYVYQNWKFGLYPDERYHALKQTLGLKNDPEKLVDRRIRCYVNLITAVNVKGDTILVLDKNNNHDLSDDVELIVSSGDAGPEQLLREIQHVPYQRLFYGKVITDTAKISLTKSATGFGYSMAEYASTEVVVGSKKYPFLIFPEGFLSRSYARVGLLDQRNRYPDPYDSLVKNGEYYRLTVKF